MFQLTSGGGLARGAAPAEAPSEFEWSRLWRALVRRRRTFFAVAIGAYALILAYTFLLPRTYTTHVKLIAGSGGGSTAATGANANTSLPLLNALLAASGVQTSETYAELFQEAPVADQVIHDLGLPIRSGALLSHVKVKPIVNTNLLDLAVTWGNRDTSAKIANAFAQAFVDRERNLVASQANAAIATLAAQVPDAQRRAATTETALTHFESANDLADIQTQTQSIINASSTIDAKISQTQLDQRQAEAQLGSVQGQLAGMGRTERGATTTAPNPVLGQLQAQLATISVQLQVAEQQYTDQHPTVIGLKHQQDELRREISRTPATVIAQANTTLNPVFEQLRQQAATLQSQVAADHAQLAQLAQQHAEMRPKIDALPKKATQLLELQREAKLSNDVLTALQQKLNEANISKATALSDVTITAPAVAADASERPNRLLNTIVGLLVSLILGVVVALLYQVFDRRIRDERQIEEDLDLPVLASVPKMNGLGTDVNAFPLLPLPGGDGGAAALPERSWLRAFAMESFLQLVTSLRYSTTADRQLRTLTITSPSQGDGKSTIALNTAITMAHIEPRVLLIDADLRRPSLHTKLNRELGRGLSDVLVGTAELDAVIVPTEHDGLDLLTSGTRTPNPVKLLQSPRFDEVLRDLQQTYRTIIIDAPALAPVIDAAILAAKSDGTVMVVSIDDTDGTAVRRAVAKLQGVGVTNFLGTVANRIQPSARALYDDYFFVGTQPPLALK